MTDISIATPGPRTSAVIARLAIARTFPLRVTCLGEIEYVQDDPVHGTYCVVTTIDLAQCGSLAEAIATVEGFAGRDRIETGEDGAVGFEPRLFVIVDGQQRRVLAGEPWRRGVRWCEPVDSDGEARVVVAEASKLRGEAAIEAGWDNYSTARNLRFRASVLEGRLVHADWRQVARAALLQAA